jgi:hypothetical protein
MWIPVDFGGGVKRQKRDCDLSPSDSSVKDSFEELYAHTFPLCDA